MTVILSTPCKYECEELAYLETVSLAELHDGLQQGLQHDGLGFTHPIHLLQAGQRTRPTGETQPGFNEKEYVAAGMAMELGRQELCVCVCVRHRVSKLLGYQPEELSKRSVYELCHVLDVPVVARSHRICKSLVTPLCYSVRS